MTPEESLRRAISQEVALAPYDANWPVLFEQERQRLLQLFGSVFLDIQYFWQQRRGGHARQTGD